MTVEDFILGLDRLFGDDFRPEVGKHTVAWLRKGEVPAERLEDLLQAVAERIDSRPTLARIRAAAVEERLTREVRFRKPSCEWCEGTGWVLAKRSAGEFVAQRCQCMERAAEKAAGRG